MMDPHDPAEQTLAALRDQLRRSTRTIRRLRRWTRVLGSAAAVLLLTYGVLGGSLFLWIKVPELVLLLPGIAAGLWAGLALTWGLVVANGRRRLAGLVRQMDPELRDPVLVSLAGEAHPAVRTLLRPLLRSAAAAGGTQEPSSTVVIRDRWRGDVIRGETLEAIAAGSLRNAALRCADFRGARLHGIDLRLADLRNANFNGADLSGGCLRAASLYAAALIGARLAGADLGGADLRFSDLRRAVLHGARLNNADLLGARLGSADLSGADLCGCSLRSSEWRGARWEGALYDDATDWPVGFDPGAHGCLRHSPGSEIVPSAPPPGWGTEVAPRD